MVNIAKWTSVLENVAELSIECCQMVEEQKKKQQAQKQGNYSSGVNSSTSTQKYNDYDVNTDRLDSADDVQLDDGYNIPLSTCTGNKKSVFIGINYYNTSSELRGCINDVDNIKAFVVKQFHFPTDSNHMRILTDDNKNHGMPTRSNIISALKWLVQGATSGDSLFLHYSGHGGSQRDPNGIEEDGMNETLIPVDYEKNGVIVDDELNELLVATLPTGVRLTCIMDCCHSGSILDLPYTYGIDSNGNTVEKDNRKAMIQMAIKAGMLLVSGNKKAALMQGVQALKFHFKNRKSSNNSSNNNNNKDVTVNTTLGDVIQFSGCRDDQTSADACIGGEATGVMSWSFIKSFEVYGYNQTYVQLLNNTRTQLKKGNYSQVPQMSTGHRMNMNTTFKI